jgi:hypothetical protein
MLRRVAPFRASTFFIPILALQQGRVEKAALSCLLDPLYCLKHLETKYLDLALERLQMFCTALSSFAQECSEEVNSEIPQELANV